MKSIKFLKMSSLLGLLINQSINHIYLLIILKTFFSECGSNNWGTSCAQTCLCDMATLRIRNGVTDSKIVSTFVYILYTRSALPPCFTCTVSVYIVTIRSFSHIIKVGCYYVCLLDGVLRHFQQYFSYIVAVSFIGGKNRRTRRKIATYLDSFHL
jgi:hypothetical protein